MKTTFFRILVCFVTILALLPTTAFASGAVRATQEFPGTTTNEPDVPNESKDRDNGWEPSDRDLPSLIRTDDEETDTETPKDDANPNTGAAATFFWSGAVLQVADLPRADRKKVL